MDGAVRAWCVYVFVCVWGGTASHILPGARFAWRRLFCACFCAWSSNLELAVPASLLLLPPHPPNRRCTAPVMRQHSTLLQAVAMARLGAVMVRMIARGLATGSSRSALFVFQKDADSWTPFVRLIYSPKPDQYCSPLGTPPVSPLSALLGWAQGRGQLGTRPRSGWCSYPNRSVPCTWSGDARGE